MKASTLETVNPSGIATIINCPAANSLLKLTSKEGPSVRASLVFAWAVKVASLLVNTGYTPIAVVVADLEAEPPTKVASAPEYSFPKLVIGLFVGAVYVPVAV